MKVKWIDADKTLPVAENGTGQSNYVLVVDNSGNMTSAWYQHECDFQKKGLSKTDEDFGGYEVGWHNSMPGSSYKPMRNITHWTKMLEAPK